MTGIDFPPLLTGLAVVGDPYLEAVKAAAVAEPGSVFYAPGEEEMQVAVLLAPEVPLREAVGVGFAVLLGLNDALGVLAPPEVGVHLEWPDRVRINGARAGKMRIAASTDDPGAEPDWLVVALDVRVVASGTVEPGETPDETTLYDEGCGEIGGMALVETWARHMMNWLHIYLTDGFAPLHEEWRAKGHGLGGPIDYPEAGTFVGLDEWGGMILKDEETTRILPLTDWVEAR